MRSIPVRAIRRPARPSSYFPTALNRSVPDPSPASSRAHTAHSLAALAQDAARSARDEAVQPLPTPPASGAVERATNNLDAEAAALIARTQDQLQLEDTHKSSVRDESGLGRQILTAYDAREQDENQQSDEADEVVQRAADEAALNSAHGDDSQTASPSDQLQNNDRAYNSRNDHLAPVVRLEPSSDLADDLLDAMSDSGFGPNINPFVSTSYKKEGPSLAPASARHDDRSESRSDTGQGRHQKEAHDEDEDDLLSARFARLRTPSPNPAASSSPRAPVLVAPERDDTPTMSLDLPSAPTVLPSLPSTPTELPVSIPGAGSARDEQPLPEDLSIFSKLVRLRASELHAPDSQEAAEKARLARASARERQAGSGLDGDQDDDEDVEGWCCEFFCLGYLRSRPESRGRPLSDINLSCLPPRSPSSSSSTSYQPLSHPIPCTRARTGICTSDASVRCTGCDSDPYCSACWAEGHERMDRQELREHRTVSIESRSRAGAGGQGRRSKKGGGPPRGAAYAL